jgi:RNA polymerase sigma-70 factor (ECF subfamily)
MNGSTPSPPPGDSLVSAHRAVGPAVFWQLAENFRPYFKHVAARILGRRLARKVDPSDVVQQSLLVAFEQADRFRGQSVDEWQGWVLTIVKNQAHKQLRHWHRHRRDVRREQPLVTDRGQEPPLAGDPSGPNQGAAPRGRAARLLAAVERLPPDYREVINWRYFHNLPYPLIAAHMNRSERAVRKLCERAVRRLRDGPWDEEA